MTDRDRKAQRIGEHLQFDFPQADTVSITTPAIRRHQEVRGARIAGLPHGQPPAAYGVNSETGGIVIGANTDPALVIADIIDAVWDGSPQFRVDKVMYADRFWRSLGVPFPTVVLEIPHQFFLLRIDRNNRLIGSQK